MFMAKLQFTTSAAEFNPPHVVGSLEVVEVDLSSMLENLFEEGDAQLSPWWRDAAAHMNVRSPSSPPSFPSFLTVNRKFLYPRPGGDRVTRTLGGVAS